MKKIIEMDLNQKNICDHSKLKITQKISRILRSRNVVTLARLIYFEKDLLKHFKTYNKVGYGVAWEI